MKATSTVVIPQESRITITLEMSATELCAFRAMLNASTGMQGAEFVIEESARYMQGVDAHLIREVAKEIHREALDVLREAGVQE